MVKKRFEVTIAQKGEILATLHIEEQTKEFAREQGHIFAGKFFRDKMEQARLFFFVKWSPEFLNG